MKSPVCAWIWYPRNTTNRINAVREALPRATIYYAHKANAHPAIVGAAAAEVDGMDCSSLGEVHSALSHGVRRIAVSGPAKTPQFLEALERLRNEHTEVEIIVHAESLLELRHIAYIGPGLAVALRVNHGAANVEATHHMGGVTPFGIPTEDIEASLKWAVANNIKVVGFSHHGMSNVLDAGQWADYGKKVIAWSVNAARILKTPLSYINLGGGLGADPRGELIDIGLLGILLGPTVDKITGGADAPRVVIEPGRYLVASSGTYVCEVVDIKTTQGKTFVVVRGGTHHFRLPAAWGYPHPFRVIAVEEWSFPWERPAIRDSVVAVHGELCTPRDVLNSAAKVKHLRVGDVLAFEDAGAYGWDISHDRFLSQEKPEHIVL